MSAPSRPNTARAPRGCSPWFPFVPSLAWIPILVLVPGPVRPRQPACRAPGMPAIRFPGWPPHGRVAVHLRRPIRVRGRCESFGWRLAAPGVAPGRPPVVTACVPAGAARGASPAWSGPRIAGIASSSNGPSPCPRLPAIRDFLRSTARTDKNDKMVPAASWMPRVCRRNIRSVLHLHCLKQDLQAGPRKRRFESPHLTKMTKCRLARDPRTGVLSFLSVLAMF